MRGKFQRVRESAQVEMVGRRQDVSLKVGSLGDAPKINKVPGVFGEVPSKEPGLMSMATRQSWHSKISLM